MSDDDRPTGELDRLLDDIRGDWRRLGAAGSDLERRRIRQEMQARFDALRLRLEKDPDASG
jgi:hypothetical protein